VIALFRPVDLPARPSSRRSPFKAAGGGVFGKSFIAAGAMIVAESRWPPMFAATARTGWQGRPPRHMPRGRHTRWGKTRNRDDPARCCCRASASNIATGVTLGISRDHR